jgi:ABC-type branched-subunit amino acid transport system ATPase component
MPTSVNSAKPVILEIEGLVAGYSTVPILHGVDLDVREGEMVAVVGPNGAGKSTLLKAILGFLPVTEGRLSVNNWSALHRRPEELSAHGVGYLPQVGNVFPSLTVAENLRMGVYAAPKSFDSRCAAVLPLFPGLSVMLGRRAGVLSGGERTMLGLARALMSAPQILLLDEPSSGLAPKIVSQVWEKLVELRLSGIALLVVEQRAKDILALADRGAVLVGGRVVKAGPCQEWTLDEVGHLFLQHAS